LENKLSFYLTGKFFVRQNPSVENWLLGKHVFFNLDNQAEFLYKMMSWLVPDE